MSITAEQIKEAILKWPGRYATEAGREFLGTPVSQMPAQLRDAGWRNVSRLDDASEFTSRGLEVVRARYIGGARVKRFCDVVVAGPITEPKYVG